MGKCWKERSEWEEGFIFYFFGAYATRKSLYYS